MMAKACLTPLLFMLWVGVSVSTVLDLQKRILGGSTCGMNERHYHVRLRLVDAKGASAFCGGSLISEEWILTAAHCRVPQRTMFADLRVHPGPERSVQITDPPVIFKDRKGRGHDIMLVKLPLKSHATVQLPKCQNRPKLGATVQIAGHAASTSGPNNKRQPGFTATLQCADTTIVDCQDIINTFKQLDSYDGFRHEHWICGKKPRVDVCKGDSGGGVVYQNRIYGVISRGDPFQTCTNPAVFVDICHRPYIKWIKKTIAKEKQWLKKCLNCG